MQVFLHDQMQIEMQTTRGLLDDVTSSANSLKATVDRTSAVIRKLASLTEVARWIPALALSILVLFVLRLVSPTYTKYTGITISESFHQYMSYFY